VALNSGDGLVGGNAGNAGHQGGTNKYPMIFDRDVSACVSTATLAADQNGPTLEQLPAGRTTVASDGANVLVNTFAAAGSPGEPGELPFHLIPPETVGDRRVGLLIRARQHDPGALGDRLRHRRLTREPLQRLPLGSRHHQLCLRDRFTPIRWLGVIRQASAPASSMNAKHRCEL
jgi:hypothetical protein